MVNEEKKQQGMETMEDYANELEASYKAFEERRSQLQVEDESPDAEKWQEIKQMELDKVSVKVKVKEVVKGGVIAYVDELRAFIPASQLSLNYVENLEEWVGQYLEARIITAEPAAKKLVLSARELLKERREQERAERLKQCQAGTVVEGTVDSLMPYGAFINLDNGLSGLIHISQISSQRIKHPGVVLQEGQRVTAKILSVQDGKISLSMKVLEEDQPEQTVKYDYKETAEATTGLGSLLKEFKL